MKPKLIIKFLLTYLFFGAAGFFAVATLSSRLTYDYLTRSRSRTLYDEASLIASTYSTVYEGSGMDLANAYPQLRAVSTYYKHIPRDLPAKCQLPEVIPIGTHGRTIHRPPAWA